MKTSAKKSSTTTATPVIQAANQPFFAKAGGGDFFAPAARASAPAVQMKMTVNQPGDKFEQEADKMSNKVMRMPTPASPMKEEKLQRQTDDKLQKKDEDKIQKAAMPEEKLQKKDDEKIQKAPATEEKLQRKGDSAPAVGASTQSAIQSHTTGGQPLSSDVRSYMEPRFNADFSNVRVHSDPEAAGLSNQLSARAFTYQNHVFFSRDQYQPGSSEGKQLLAHELTHTIQQGHAVQRSPQVSTTTTPPPIQREFSFPDIDIPNPIEYFTNKVTDFVKQHAEELPGFTMLTVVMGKNPITGASVDRSAGNILRGAIQMLPGVGNYITQALDNHGVFDKVSVWAEQQFNTIKDIGSNIWQDIKNFIKTFSLTDLKDPGGIWSKAKAIVTGPIDQIKSFARGLVSGIGALIKEAILKPIAAFAKANAPNGYDLLSAVLGYDPISGDPVPPTAENLISPFMKLIGQEEVWQNMKKANAVSRAFAWFKGAVGAVRGFVTQIPGLFVAAFKSLEIMDIILLSNAFNKVKSVFGGFIENFISWAGTAVWNLLEIIFDAISPGALGYIKRTGAALKGILKNPLPFVGNLVKAAKLGFANFAANFGGHLKAGLIDWLTGSLPGVYIPKAFSLVEIGKFVLSVLGITWAQIRGKIVKALGKNGEMIMKGLETGFDIVVALVKGGPAAAWELIKEKLGDLKDTVIGGITDFVVDMVVKKAVPKLLAMFVPGAGFISAILSIYDTVMVFVNKLSKIIQVVTGFIDSIVAIAGGAIGAAANRVEGILAGLLSLAINFLAGFAGLGKVADKVMGVLERVRTSVDKAIDAAIVWIVGKAKKLVSSVAQAGLPKDPNERLKLGMAAAVSVVNRLSGNRVGNALITPVLAPLKVRYGFTQLDPISEQNQWYLQGVINPSLKLKTQKEDGTEEEVKLSVGDVIKAKYVDGMWVATIESISQSNVTYRFSDTRKGQEVVSKSIFIDSFNKGEITTYIADKRGTFMGGNPPKSQLLSVYKSEGTHYRFRATDQVQFPRRAGGRWYDVSECDLSHEPIDAVTYWNTEGYKYGPRSPEVRAWMIDINNYIFEPASLNRSRGSRSAENYRLPAKVE